MNISNLFKGYFTCCLLLCTIHLSVDAQEISNLRFTNINTHNGLPNNNVNAVVRDKRGFLWVATNDGLCRYDSPENFKMFYASENEELDGLKSSNISTLYIDSKDNLWIGTRLGGLSRYHLPTEKWTTFLHDPSDKNSLSNNEVLCITEDKSQNIWIGTEDGLNLYRPEEEAFIVFRENGTNPNSLSSKAVLSIAVDNQGWIWVGTWNGGIHLITLPESGDLSKIQFRNVTPTKNEEVWNAWEIYQDKEQRYWVGTFGHGLFLMQLPSSASNKINNQNWQPNFHNYIPADKGKQPISSSLVKDILQDEKGRLWIASVKGLNHILPHQLPDPKVFNTPTKKRPKILFNQHIYNPKNKYAIAHNDINHIYEDNQGLLWFGTFGGVSKHNWFTNQFSVIEIFDFQQETPNTQNMYVDNDRIAWIGAGPNGLVKYDLNSGEYWKVNKTVPGLLTHKNVHVYAIHSPNDRDIYIATNLGVIILNRKTGHYTEFQTPERFKEQNILYAIHCVYIDKYHKIWLGTGAGLFSLNPKTGKYKSYLYHPENPKSISDNSINAITEDTYGKLWIATSNGLNVSADYGEEVATFQRYKASKVNSSDERTIASNQITALKQVQDELYIGTTNGLIGFDLINQTFTNYKTTKRSIYIRSIESSNPTELWFSTTEGIISFDITKKQFNLFEQADGLGDLTFRKGSSSIDTFGNYYFGSRQGLTAIQPSTIKKNTTLPPVYITDVEKVNSERRAIINCINREDYILDYDDYYLSIKFAALNYNRPEKNIYAYKLEGLEKNWNYATSTTPVVYTNLNHGTYTFRVKAANNDGLWNEAGATIKIIKKPAFWETWWFKLLSLLLIGVITGIIIKYYTKSVHNRNQLLERHNSALNKQIEERKKIEKALASREKILRLIMDSVPQFIGWIDKDFRILGSNKILSNFLNLKDKKNMVGKSVADFSLPSIYKKAVLQKLENVLTSQTPIINEVSQLPSYKNFPRLWIEQSFMPLFDDTGEIFGILICGSNITKRVQHEEMAKSYTSKLQDSNEELKRSNKDLEQFAYIASHDLQEPLRIIGNFTGLLAQAYKTKLDQDAFTYIDFIETSVKRMSNLINSVLTYSRVGRKETQFERINLNHLLEWKLVELSQLIKERNAKITIKSLPEVTGNPNQIAMVFQNLIMNALKFNKSQQPEVCIQREEANSPNFWQFSVADNGIGIAPEYQKQIFGIFRRLHSKKEYKGTGIGLSICHKIIFRHKGTIWVESSPCGGTKFRFTIAKEVINIPKKIEQYL